MTTLANGVRVITEVMPHVRSVSVGIWIGTGSRRETPEQNGISHFIEHMLFKGTTSRSAEDIARCVDSIGGNLDAFTAKELVCFNTKVLDQHLSLAFDVLADLVLHPMFREEDIEKEKGVILEEIKMEEDSPDYLVHEIFSSNFWKDHPLGKPILGTPQTVRRFDRTMVRDFYRSVYAPANMVVTAAGNLTHERLTGAGARAFRIAAARATRRPRSRRPARMPALRCATRNRWSRCTCAWAFPRTRCRTQERFACYVLNTLLGGGMSSRLFQNIRERQGLAYAVFSELNPYRDTGCLSIYAGHQRGIGAARWWSPSRKEFRELKAGAGERRGTAPRQGPPQGLADAEPGIHRQPHVEPGPPGDVLRPVLHPGRAGGEHRSRDRGRRAAHRADVLRSRSRSR